MQVCWFIMECFEQCSQWNAKWGLGLEPWGFFYFSSFMNMKFWMLVWICFLHLCSFVHCAIVQLCDSLLKLEFVWYDWGLRTWNFGWVVVKGHCYCIWVEFLLRLGFKSLAMFEPCNVHVVYVCVTSYWVVCSILSFKTFFW